ncbi:hypothetical protein WN55_05435 [Dufourea novaeangliae]|uniref:Uncharacterized protein n=1 Tax=Dufourea novaeangliae TaxID=178035 RepID=A0A154P0F7_DUFNO|nr:hypothetical protein WN55_05435 [Dufourea novaeangliae]
MESAGKDAEARHNRVDTTLSHPIRPGYRNYVPSFILMITWGTALNVDHPLAVDHFYCLA